MRTIRPVSDLRNNFADISRDVHESGQPVFLTKNGAGDMVVMSMEAYDELLSVTTTDAAIAEAEGELERGGRLTDARSALAGLRRKHF